MSAMLSLPNGEARYTFIDLLFFLKALNRGKGLLPEPNLLQILNSLGNPSSIQLLLNPLLHGAIGGKQGKYKATLWDASDKCPEQGGHLYLFLPPLS